MCEKCWLIKLNSKDSRNYVRSYYLSGFRRVDGGIIPTRVMRYRAEDHACHFRSIKDACAVVRQLDHSNYRIIIVPSSEVF